MSSLNLRHHHPIVVEYEATEDAVAEPAPLNVKYGVSLGPNTTNPLDWRVMLTVIFSAETKTKKTLVKGRIVFVGYFDISADTPEDKRQEFMARNGASVLYSATRELLANISFRSPNREVVLPLATFHNIEIDPNAEKTEVEAAG